MRQRWVGVLGAMVAVGLHVSCKDVCDDGLCEDPPGAGGSGSTGGSGGEGGQGGSGGGTPDGCVPSKLGAGVALGQTCEGVFVNGSDGKDDGDGSREAPFASLSKAVESAGGKAIYVCAAAKAAVGGVVIEASQDVFGGLDCGTWSYSGTQSAVEGVANVPAVTVSGAVDVRLEDLAITAVDASEPGAHSIGVLSLGGDVVLARVTLRAGKGATGAAGTDGGEPEETVTAMDGKNGLAAGGVPMKAQGGENSCIAQVLAGGLGGLGGDKDAGVISGGGGTAGDAGGGAAPGAGQPEVGAWSCSAGQGLGDGGGNGNPGSPGAGGSGLGTLGAEGLQGRDGEAGGPATSGKSGGGGGGSKASGSAHGAGGGGGGAGGCAGKSGGGGMAGGSSLALAAAGGTLSLEQVELYVGTAGDGGVGGEGQFGQSGGAAGPSGGGAGAVDAGCAGGKGGDGGDGGNGGGGAGGHAIGLAHSGATLTGAPTVHLDGAIAGDGGDGGDNGGEPGLNGDAGTLGEVVELGG